MIEAAKDDMHRNNKKEEGQNERKRNGIGKNLDMNCVEGPEVGRCSEM